MFRSNITSVALLLFVLVTACGTAHGADNPGSVKPLEGFPGAAINERLSAMKKAGASALQTGETTSASADMDSIYRSLTITNARTVGGPYAPGDVVTVAYEITNTSNADLKVPVDRSYSRPYNFRPPDTAPS